MGFSLFFLMELTIKVLGLGVRGYFSDSYNVFDSIVVSASITDLIVQNVSKHENLTVITTFRAFRLLRLFKLAKNWRRLNYLLISMKKTLQDVSMFSILLFIFMFVFALLGMELFANTVKITLDDRIDLLASDANPPGNNFDTLLNAFTTVFVVMTADGWSGIYFSHYRGNPDVFTTIYFVLLIIVGQRILLNLFLAILLQNFDENELRDQVEKEQLKNPDKVMAYLNSKKEQLK